jgi:hypothetical protein
MVEATEGCDINQGKCAKRVKSTKFVNVHYITCDFKTREKFIEVSTIKTLTENSNFLSLPRNFMQNGKVGKGDVFSQENIFIALVA